MVDTWYSFDRYQLPLHQDWSYHYTKYFVFCVLMMNTIQVGNNTREHLVELNMSAWGLDPAISFLIYTVWYLTEILKALT